MTQPAEQAARALLTKVKLMLWAKEDLEPIEKVITDALLTRERAARREEADRWVVLMRNNRAWQEVGRIEDERLNTALRRDPAGDAGQEVEGGMIRALIQYWIAAWRYERQLRKTERILGVRIPR